MSLCQHSGLVAFCGRAVGHRCDPIPCISCASAGWWLRQPQVDSRRRLNLAATASTLPDTLWRLQLNHTSTGPRYRLLSHGLLHMNGADGAPPQCLGTSEGPLGELMALVGCSNDEAQWRLNPPTSPPGEGESSRGDYTLQSADGTCFQAFSAVSDDSGASRFLLISQDISQTSKGKRLRGASGTVGPATLRRAACDGETNDQSVWTLRYVGIFDASEREVRSARITAKSSWHWRLPHGPSCRRVLCILAQPWHGVVVSARCRQEP